MVEIVIGIILIILVCVLIFYGVIFFVMGTGYGYWGLSIGMGPILWLLMGIGLIVGFICAAKNAIKAAKAMKDKKGN